MVVVVTVMAVIVMVLVMPMGIRLQLAFKPQHQLWIHGTTSHGQQSRPGPNPLPQIARHPLELPGIHAVGTAHQHQIRRLQLIAEQLINGGDVVQVWVLLALALQGVGVSHRAARRQRFAIHQRHHAVDMHAAADRRPVEGLQQRARQSQTAGFNHDAVQLIGTLQQLFHRRQEIILNRAAEAAVVEFNQAALQLLLRAEATTSDQITIQTDAAELIHHHRQPLAAGGEQMAQHRGFAGPEKSGDHRHRQTLHHEGVGIRGDSRGSRGWRHQCARSRQPPGHRGHAAGADPEPLQKNQPHRSGHR